MLAQAIHKASPRAAHAFTAINMASLNGSLFDAEFFGHTRGAFTGAEKARSGYLEKTHLGTLFLDEIGHLPLEVQGKLLRFMQDGSYYRVGASTHRQSDIRICCRHQCRPGQTHGQGIVPQRSLLPHQGRVAAPIALEGKKRRYSAPGESLYEH